MVRSDADGVPRLERLRAGRSLKTAAEALAALRILGASPDGLTAEALAGELGKSPATARYLLNTLCQEGYALKEGPVGVHRLRPLPPWGEAWGARPAPERHELPERYELPERLSDAVTELYARTRQRTYLAQWEDDATVIVDARGHQGLARIPDLCERIPLAQAHALAVSKALVASSAELEELLFDGAASSGFTAFTPATITSTPRMELELARVRRHGVALDREEFAEGFCCVGAPIVAPDGRVAASLAVSTPTRRFAQYSDEITRAVCEVAGEASRAWREQGAAGPTDGADGADAPTDHPTPDPAAPVDLPSRRRRRSARVPRREPEEVSERR